MIGLYFFGVVALWCWLSWRLFRFGRQFVKPGTARRPLRILLIVIVAVTWLGASFWYGGGRTIYYDMEVQRLCAIDGGVKVYEQVKLPAEQYDAYAQRNWILPDKAQAKPEDEYFSETDRHYFLNGNPEMSRRQYRVIRRSDAKVLGEMVRYGRGGGDLPGPWHPSSFTCPRPTEGPYLEPSIFQKGDF
jgi:hypothetical protein